MEKELTETSVKEGGMLWLTIGLFGFGLKMFESGDQVIGGSALAASIVLVMIREYYKPN